jgi:hypothetical protein
MKSILILFFLAFATLAFCDQDWIYIRRDEKIGQFQLNSKGKLQYNGQTIDSFSLEPKADRLAISPFSPDGKFAVAFSFGDLSQCAVLDFEKHNAETISLDGTPVVWNSWSNTGPYLLLSSYTDTDNNLYAIDLSNLKVKKIPVSVQKDGEKTEFVTTTVDWNAPNSFEIEALIHCASCDSREEEKVIRSYKLHINAETSEVQAEELPPAPVEEKP